MGFMTARLGPDRPYLHQQQDRISAAAYVTRLGRDKKDEEEIVDSRRQMRPTDKKVSTAPPLLYINCKIL